MQPPAPQEATISSQPITSRPPGSMQGQHAPDSSSSKVSTLLLRLEASGSKLGNISGTDRKNKKGACLTGMTRWTERHSRPEATGPLRRAAAKPLVLSPSWRRERETPGFHRRGGRRERWGGENGGRRERWEARTVGGGGTGQGVCVCAQLLSHQVKPMSERWGKEGSSRIKVFQKL